MRQPQYTSLNISKEEISAIRRYISNAHISMNALLDIDPNVINEQQSKGWLIDFSKEEIENNIEYLTKLYSAMYKYSLQNGNEKQRVYRGTTKKEVNKLKHEGISGRFLSTSKDKNVAVSFTEYNNGALLEMTLNGIPYISTDEFLGEHQFSESEILVAPFSIMENIQEYNYGNNSGYVEYSASVKKKDFFNITDEERKQYNENINSFDFKGNLSKYDEISFKIESLERNILRFGEPKNKNDREELDYMLNLKEKLTKDLSEINNNFKTVKQYLSNILQDRFKTVELEIEQVLEQEKKSIEEKEIKRKIEFEKMRKADFLIRVDDMFEDIDNIEEYYKTIDEEDKMLYNAAEELKIDDTKMLSVDDNVVSKFEELKKKIEEIKQEIENIEITDQLTSEELAVDGEINQKYEKIFGKTSIIKHIMKECKNTIQITKENNRAMLSNEVATKLGEGIINKVKSDLLLEEKQLLAKKDTLWDKITGKSKIKAAQIENLRLRREYVQKSGLNTPRTMKKMIVYAAKYKEVLGEESLPEEVRKIMTSYTVDITVSAEELDMFEIARAGNSLMTVKKSKKEILSEFNSKNKILKEKNNIELPVDSVENLSMEKMVKNSVEKCLDTALFYTEDLTEERNKQIIKDGITL